MKRVLAVLTALAMLLAMTACGVQGDTAVVGTWETDVDYAAVINACIAQNEVLAASGATLDSAPVEVTYTFGEDGTATGVIDQEQLYASLFVLFEEILTPVIAAMGAGMTVDQYVAESTLSREELLISLFTDDVMKSIKNTVGFEGTYALKGDELTVTVGGNTSTAKVKNNGDALMITTPIGTTASSEAQQVAVKALFPLELKKVG